MNHSASITMSLQHVTRLFEEELRRRCLPFSIDAESGLHLLEKDGTKMLICLDNLTRDLGGEPDAERVSRFIDNVVNQPRRECGKAERKNLFWSLEPNDYEQPADFRASISKHAERVLIHWEDESNSLEWLTPSLLEELELSPEEASEIAFENLASELSRSTFEAKDVQGVKLGIFSSELPFKASLLLAPNLREAVEEQIGWPIYAVAPVRDFLYVWSADHRDFSMKVGPVVVKEYTSSPYPISTEVFFLDGNEIRAIGAFDVDTKKEQ